MPYAEKFPPVVISLTSTSLGLRSAAVQFPQLQRFGVFEKYVESSRRGHEKPRPAFENSAVDEQRAEESPGRSQQQTRCADPPTLQRFDGGDIGQAIDRQQMRRHVRIGEVEQAPRKPPRPSFDQHLLVWVDAPPPYSRAAEESQAVVRVPTATVPPATEVVDEPRNVEPV